MDNIPSIFGFEFVDGILVGKIGMLATAALALGMLLLGRFIKTKVGFLRKYYIPAPVVGGLVFAVINLILFIFKVQISFDITIQTIAMSMFFTSVGYMASWRDLRKGGAAVIVFLGIASILIILQNVIGMGVAVIFQQNPLFGLVMGSIPFTGGHGTVSGWQGALTNMLGDTAGATAYVLGVVAATYGLVTGCLIGGPVAKKIKAKFNVQASHVSEEQKAVLKGKEARLTEGSLLTGVIIIFACMGLAEPIKPFFDWVLGLIKNPSTGKAMISLPTYILSMLFAAAARNILEAMKKDTHAKEVEVAGGIGLQVFLAIAITTLELGKIIQLDVSLIAAFAVSLVVQVAVMALFAYFVTFRLMGKDYDACVIACGHCGFGLGATPTAMANMDTFVVTNGLSIKAYLVVPLVGAMFIDFTNALILSGFVAISSLF